MKRFICAFLVLLPCLMFTGCKGKPPAFKMDLTGVVVESTTNITTNFTIGTFNVAENYFAPDASVKYGVLSKYVHTDAYNWLTQKVIKAVSKNYPNGALYDISAKGYIEWHGVKLSFDEHWNNKGSLALNSSSLDKSAPIIYLPKEKRCCAQAKCKSDYKARFDYVGY